MINFSVTHRQKQIFLTNFLLTNVNHQSLDFNEVELLQIIRALNINKAHGHDDISIRMIKICYRSLVKPLIVLLRNSIKPSGYPDILKKSNIIPVHKKISNWLKTADQILFCLSLVKSSKKILSIEFKTFY